MTETVTYPCSRPFGLLRWHEQRALHDYFLPSKKLSDVALLAHRHQVTIEQPSLPQRAGRALARCQSNMAEFAVHPPVPYVRQPGKRIHRSAGEYRVVVRGVARADFKPQRLVNIAKELQHKGDAEAA
ncbi:hypothetical protein A5735_01335 [Mycolicibacter heraklionensis]|nr:hypothetical protein A5735_01335 [Mycolicibacter heraklionensis]